MGLLFGNGDDGNEDFATMIENGKLRKELDALKVEHERYVAGAQAEALAIIAAADAREAVLRKLVEWYEHEYPRPK